MLSDLGKKDGRSQRIAYYLDWAAKARPYHYQPFNVIVTVIQNYGSLRRVDSDEVIAARSSLGSAKKILQKVYGRDLDTAGASARATVNDEDTASVSLPKKMRRIRSAKNSALATYNLIDQSKVKDPKIKSYLSKSVKDIIKMIGSEDFDKKLLPPSSSE